MNHTHYIGYGSLEDLLEQAQAVKATLFADIFSLFSPTSMGMEYRHSYVQVSFLEAELAHVWRWKITGVLHTPNGDSFEPGQSKLAETRAASAWNCIWTQLDALDFHVIRSVVATPRDILLMEGHCPAFMVLDREQGIYLLPAHAEAQHA